MAASSSSALRLRSARTPTRRALERATRRARKAPKSFSSAVTARGSSRTTEPLGMGNAAATFLTRSVSLDASAASPALTLPAFLGKTTRRAL